MRMYRQGDILLIEVTELPDDLTEVNSGVIREGITGHKHRVENARLSFARGWGDITMYVSSGEPFQVTHPEHDTLNLPAGNYKIVIQRNINANIYD